MPDDYISMVQAAKILPGRPHRSTVIRWTTRGIGGKRLQAVRFGNKMLTRPIWCREFTTGVINAAPVVRATSSHQAAEAKLDALGV